MRSELGFATVTLLMIAGIAGSAIAWTNNPKSGHDAASTSTTTRTCTGIPAISYLYCGGQLRISAEGTPGATPYFENVTQGSWNFTASISSNSVTAGGQIKLWANITNISGQNETFKLFVKPYVNPTVSAANGTEVWAWDPPQSTWPDTTITDGETLSQFVIIPTSELQPGHSYFITVAPLFIHLPTPNNLTFTFIVAVI
jgi:hypothetical protein